MSLHLDVESHTYTDSTGEKYESVTRFINKFVPSFDFDAQSKRYAAKYGLNVDDVRAGWRKKNEDSTNFGTKIHSLIESYLNEEKIPEDKTFKVIESICDEIRSCNKGKYLIEEIVYNEKRKIAGMSDLIVVNGDSFNVVDFKTNKQIKHGNDYQDKFLLKPVDHLPNGEYFKYSLQLSFYAYFFTELTGKKVDRLCFYWLKRKKIENYDDLTGAQWCRYNVPYLKEEVENCLRYEQ
jgi:ATP-dependent exoDNAse (exonuclease V) beta subunit